MNELMLAKFRAVHPELFAHPKHGNLYFESGAWYWARRGCRGVRVGESLVAAIPVVMAAIENEM